MGEQKLDGGESRENIIESRHRRAIDKLANATVKRVGEYIYSRGHNSDYLIKDTVMVAGGMLVGMGIWQLVGGQIPNVYEALNVLHLPYVDELGQKIIDVSPGVKIVGGALAMINADMVRAYSMNVISSLKVKRK